MGDKRSGKNKGRFGILDFYAQVAQIYTSFHLIQFFYYYYYLFLYLFQEDFPHNAHHREISISVSNYTLKHGDAGLVIVGGRMEMQPHVCLSISSVLCIHY